MVTTSQINLPSTGAPPVPLVPDARVRDDAFLEAVSKQERLTIAVASTLGFFFLIVGVIGQIWPLAIVGATLLASPWLVDLVFDRLESKAAEYTVITKAEVR